MLRLRAPVLAGILACVGCARTPTRELAPEDDPSGERRLQQTLLISQRESDRWSPVATIPLYPVLLAVDLPIDIARATAAWAQEMVAMIRELLYGKSSELPRPEAVERAAESLQRK